MKGQLSNRELHQALKHVMSTDISFLSPSDESEILAVWADAFIQDPMVLWVAELDDNDPEKTPKLNDLNKYMMSWLNHRAINGSRGMVVGMRSAENDLIGCMSILPSSCTKERIFDTIRSIVKLGIPPMYKSKKTGMYYGTHSAVRLESLGILPKARAKHMKDIKRWIYLQTIGVRTNRHGKGYGKKMLLLVNEVADMLNVPIYLETESKENESMYHHFGYDTVEIVNVSAKGDESPTAVLPMYLMKRNPVCTEK